MRKDPFRLHKLALAPFLESDHPVDFPSLLAEADKEGNNDFLKFLIHNGLAPLWHEALTNRIQKDKVDPVFTEKLRQVRLTAEANYLLQKKSLKKIHDTLTSAGIKYAVFKGAVTRELVYEKPALRPCTDIDVLISTNDRDTAIQALITSGMNYKHDEINISHECTFFDGVVQIDFHWHIMRPDRMRLEMTELLLNNSELLDEFVGLGGPENMFVILVHPVFAKYATAPQSLLIRLIDLMRFINLRQFDWDRVNALLDTAGNCTAAWIMSEWLQVLTSDSPPRSLIERIQPGKLRSKYLQYWISNNLSSRYINHPIITQFAFTLPAQDNFSDASRFLIQLLKRNLSSKKI